MPATFLVEMAGHAGFDFVVLDAEHGVADTSTIHAHIAVASAVGLGALVRVHPAELATAGRLIDLGAAGILVPDIRTVDQARAAVNTLRVPPFGDRGFATGCSAAGWGLGDVDGHARRSPIIVTMLEHPDAIRAAEGISAVDGIDGVFVGRMDLAMASGDGPRPESDRVTAALESVRRGSRSRILETEPGASLRLVNATRVIGVGLRAALSAD